MTEVIPYLFYDDVPAALDFLARAFGFVEDMRHETANGGMHAEMNLDGRRIMMGRGDEARRMRSAAAVGTATMGIFVTVADIDAHYARAKAAGATIDAEPRDEGYGRTYTARDIGCHPWFFTEASTGA